MSVRINKDTGEVFLYGIVGDAWGEESFTSGDVIDALSKLGGKRAIIRINSPGGVADEGIAIYNAIKRYPAGADTVVDALAASAASVIALAGDKRTTASGARWMIHRALTVEVGNATQLRKTADTLDTYDSSIAEIYSKYMKNEQGHNLQKEQILQLMDAETWFTSESSVSAGLATQLGEHSDVLPVVAAWFSNAPESLYNSQPEATKSENSGKSQLARIKARLLSLKANSIKKLDKSKKDL